jgi:hypothetical protein
MRAIFLGQQNWIKIPERSARPIAVLHLFFDQSRHAVVRRKQFTRLFRFYQIYLGCWANDEEDEADEEDDG